MRHWALRLLRFTEIFRHAKMAFLFGLQVSTPQPGEGEDVGDAAERSCSKYQLIGWRSSGVFAFSTQLGDEEVLRH